VQVTPEGGLCQRLEDEIGGRPFSERSCCSVLHREDVLHLPLHYTLRGADELAQHSMLDRARLAALLPSERLLSCILHSYLNAEKEKEKSWDGLVAARLQQCS
jgi:hypothetical protein